jgi:putative membrane protein (TIGR04086 family)
VVTRAIALGAAVVLLVGVPIAVVGAVALDEGSNLVFPLAAVVLAGFVAGGWYAARQEPRSALLVGAAAALAGFAVAQVVSIALQVAQDEDVRPAAVLANAVLAAACGVAGGAVARR